MIMFMLYVYEKRERERKNRGMIRCEKFLLSRVDQMMIRFRFENENKGNICFTHLRNQDLDKHLSSLSSVVVRLDDQPSYVVS